MYDSGTRVSSHRVSSIKLNKHGLIESEFCTTVPTVAKLNSGNPSVRKGRQFLNFQPVLDSTQIVPATIAECKTCVVARDATFFYNFRDISLY